ncbi:Na+/H+ antiporter NhaA [Geobacter pelophilus]|uniref:Na+/H+ antiporter NhaA n=1 Tax=Geoanaerobacter pelophilus TaxID=60036 RepID=A0AAW4LCA8_9BACT|nr:Na+/H+ antiporter NhaA [Geoanaerobacter pelophilus]MBT0665664.1 Na+/H+ antiporter NhaA [Geoanaerobacter pelophilus]
MKHRLNLLREFSIPLLAGVVVAIVWANLDPAGYRDFNTTPFLGKLSFHFVANELFMVLFFGIAAVEITQSFLPGGDLSPISKAVNPLMGTLGGVIGPVVVYLSLNTAIGAPELRNGWGIPTATDIALAWLAARAVFGAANPAVSYLLLLAVADDAIGLGIIAIFYPNPNLPTEPLWLLLTGAAMAVAYLMRRGNLRSYWPYLLVGGTMSWTGLHNAHLHPALALVFIIPFLPHAKAEHKHLFEADPGDHSTLARFEHEWKVFVDFGLFMFSLSNAGVQFSSMGTVTFLVLASLLAGKTCGIFCFGWLAARLGFGLPRGMKQLDLLIAGVIAGTGFTVALFVAGEAFRDPMIAGAAKMGAMLSIIAALAALVLGKLAGVEKKF